MNSFMSMVQRMGAPPPSPPPESIASESVLSEPINRGNVYESLEWDNDYLPPPPIENDELLVQPESETYKEDVPILDRVRDTLGLGGNSPPPSTEYDQINDLRGQITDILSIVDDLRQENKALKEDQVLMKSEHKFFQDSTNTRFDKEKQESRDYIHSAHFGSSNDTLGIEVPYCAPGEENEFPSLERAERLKLIDSNFPQRGKFSGGSQGPKVREFLESFTRAQKIVKLTYPELCQVLITRCQSPAYEQVCQLVNSKNSMTAIYRALINSFNTEKPPTYYQTLLYNYVPPKNLSFTQIVREISDLAYKASMQFKTPSSRINYFNNTAIESLKRCLPPNVTRYIEDCISRYSALHNELPTFEEVRQGLDRSLDTLESELKSCPGFRFSQPRDYMQFDRNTRSYNERPRYQGNVGAIRGNNNKNDQQHNKANTNAFDYKGTNKIANNRGRTMNRRSDNPRNTKRQNNQNRSRNPRAQNISSKEGLGRSGRSDFDSISGGKKYCELCGASSHLAADLCYSMRNDSGKLVNASPAFGHCENCVAKIKTKLYHPENLCPLRDALLKLYRTKKVKPYGLFAKYLNNNRRQ